MNNGLKIEGLSTCEDRVFNEITISASVANKLAQSAGFKTAIFNPYSGTAAEDSFLSIYGNIGFNYSIEAPVEYYDEGPKGLEYLYHKMIAMSCVREPFVLMSASSFMFNDRILKILETIDSNNIFSYRLPFPGPDFNRYLLNFWDPIFPKSFQFNDDVDYHAYNMSILFAKDPSLINTVASEIVEFLITRKSEIEPILETQTKFNEYGENMNPEFEFMIESIIFPHLVLSKSSPQESRVLFPEKISSATGERFVESGVLGKLDNAIFASAESSSQVIKSIYDAFKIYIPQIFSIEGWKKDVYKYYKENNLEKQLLEK